jgi:hypothetical protein
MHSEFHTRTKTMLLKAFVIMTPEKEKTPHAYQKISWAYGVMGLSNSKKVFSTFATLKSPLIPLWERGK